MFRLLLIDELIALKQLGYFGRNMHKKCISFIKKLQKFSSAGAYTPLPLVVQPRPSMASSS